MRPERESDLDLDLNDIETEDSRGDVINVVDPHGEEDTVQRILVSDIEPDPNQPRKDKSSPDYLEELEGLMNSIQEVGLKDPIVVRVHPDADSPFKWMIVKGETRWTAHKKLEMLKIRAFIKRGSELDHEIEQSLENIRRRNLSPFEEALDVQKYETKYGWDKAKYQKVFGVGDSWYSQRKGLLKLPEDVLEIAAAGLVRDKEFLRKMGKKSPEERAKLIKHIHAGTFTGEMIKKSVDAVEKAAEKKAEKEASKKEQPKTNRFRVNMEPSAAIQILNKFDVEFDEDCVVSIKKTMNELLDSLNSEVEESA